MKVDKFDGCARGFSRHTTAHYAEAVPLPEGMVERIEFGYYPHAGGTVGEMQMVWYDGKKFDEGKPVARFMVYEDAFGSLGRMADVVAALGEYDCKLIQPDEFCALLTAHGFTEFTAATLM